MGKLIDVSHTIENNLVTYKGLPSPVISDYLSRDASQTSYAQGTTFHIGKIEMVANTGTYIDAPFHRYAKGKDLAELTLEQTAELDGVVFHADQTVRAIGPEVFAGAKVDGKAVLIHTGWDKYWKSDQYFQEHPFLTQAAAKWLVKRNVALVGIDSLNIDDITDGYRPAHSILLEADIPIVEHLCHLNRLPDIGFKFNAVPVKVRGFGTFPIRAYGVVPS